MLEAIKKHEENLRGLVQKYQQEKIHQDYIARKVNQIMEIITDEIRKKYF